MSFLVSALSGVVAFFKKGSLIKRKIRAMMSSAIAFVVMGLLFISIIGGAIYSVTGAVSELFNSILAIFDTSDPDLIDYDDLTDEQIAELRDKSGATLEPRKVVDYMNVEIKSVPKSIEREKITETKNNGVGGISNKEDIELDLTEFVNKYKVNWEFIASVDLATFKADNINDTSSVDNADSILPKFTWLEDASRVETSTKQEWEYVYEIDNKTGKKTVIRGSEEVPEGCMEVSNIITTPIAIPKKVETMFGDYIYNISEDVVLTDNPYCQPYIFEEKKEDRQVEDYVTDDLTKPIWGDDESKPKIEIVPNWAQVYEYDKYNMIFKSCIKYGKKNTGGKYVVIYERPDSMAGTLMKYSSDKEIRILTTCEKEDWMEVQTSKGIGYTRMSWFDIGEEQPESYSEVHHGFEQKIVGYEQKTVYKTITTYTKIMKRDKLKITEDQVVNIKNDFDPTDFIKYINSVGLKVKDLELVRECLVSIPNGSNIVDVIDRIIAGDYGDVLEMGGSNNTGGNNVAMGSMAGVIPLYLQYDDRWKDHPYSSGNMASSGCGPTTMAMIITGMMGNASSFDMNSDGVVDPKELAIWSTNTGHVIPGQGSTNSLITDSAALAGLSCRQTTNFEEVKEALKNGKVVVDNVDKNVELGSGKHFLVLTGVDSEGKISINDPNSLENSKKTWDENIIKKITMTYWIIDNEKLNYQQKFIMRIRKGAVESQKETGIFASVTLAQGALESGWGKNAVNNNLFGIKADSSWTGPKAYLATTEYCGIPQYDWFRVYDSWEQGITDHGMFLVQNSRYAEAGVFTAKDCYEQCRAIEKAGYATAEDEFGNPTYAKALIKIIDDYKLNIYDKIDN